MYDERGSQQLPTAIFMFSPCGWCALQSGELQGSLTGVRLRQYVPDSYVDAQHEAAYSFFAANGYLDQATATEMQVCTALVQYPHKA